MRNVALAVAVFVLVAAAACSHDPAVSLDAERERLEERQSEFFAALEARDAERMAELFSDDAVVHVANRPPLEGRGAIRAFYGNMFGFLSASSATPERVHMSGAGDLAYSTGGTSNEFHSPEGTVAYTGKYLLVWEKREDHWMIAAYSISSDESAPEA